MNRGSGAEHRQADRPAGRFNEAPIHESGKCERFGSLSGAVVSLQ